MYLYHTYDTLLQRPADGTDIRYECNNPAPVILSNGTTFLFCHGIAGTPNHWGASVQAARAETFRALESAHFRATQVASAVLSRRRDDSHRSGMSTSDILRTGTAI